MNMILYVTMDHGIMYIRGANPSKGTRKTCSLAQMTWDMTLEELAEKQYKEFVWRSQTCLRSLRLLFDLRDLERDRNLIHKGANPAISHPICRGCVCFDFCRNSFANGLCFFGLALLVLCSLCLWCHFLLSPKVGFGMLEQFSLCRKLLSLLFDTSSNSSTCIGIFGACNGLPVSCLSTEFYQPPPSISNCSMWHP